MRDKMQTVAEEFEEHRPTKDEIDAAGSDAEDDEALDQDDGDDDEAISDDASAEDADEDDDEDEIGATPAELDLGEEHGLAVDANLSLDIPDSLEFDLGDLATEAPDRASPVKRPLAVATAPEPTLPQDPAALDVALLRVDSLLLDELETVAERKERVISLIANTRSKKSAVKSEIFQRVLRDYEKQLDAVEAEYRPLTERLCRALVGVHEHEVWLDEHIKKVSDVIDELKFRCEVGEFPEEDLFPMENENTTRLRELQTRMGVINETYATCLQYLSQEEFEAATGRVYASGVSAEARTEASSIEDMDIPEVEPDISVFTSVEPSSQRLRAAGNDVPTLYEGATQETSKPVRGMTEAVTQAEDRRLAFLVLKREDGKEDAHQLGSAPFSIGRHRSNHLVLSERGVSRRHAAITYEDDGHYVITDLSSGNGIYVNGARVPEKAVLANGNTISVGTFTLTFVER